MLALTHLLCQRTEVLQGRFVAAQVEHGAGEAVAGLCVGRLQFQRAAGSQEGLQARLRGSRGQG